MADRMITFNVRRFDGERAFNQEYSIPYEKNTLLGCLTKIREEQDASLCFTSACRHAICGSCAVQVNGNAFLACETQLDTLLETFGTDELFLEPLNNLPVVRDLVVNFDGIADKMRKVEAWMCPHKDRKDHLQTPEQFHLIAKPADCVLCGSRTTCGSASIASSARRSAPSTSPWRRRSAICAAARCRWGRPSPRARAMRTASITT